MFGLYLVAVKMNHGLNQQICFSENVDPNLAGVRMQC